MHNNGSGYVMVTESFQISVVKHNAWLFLLTCAKYPPGVNGGGRSSLCCPERWTLYPWDHHSWQGDRKVMDGLNFVGFYDTSMAKGSHMAVINLKTVS